VSCSKDQDTLTEQSVTRINVAHRIIVKQVVYNANRDSET